MSHIQDRLLTTSGTIRVAGQRLTAWLGQGKGGTRCAYDFFHKASKRVPWVKIVWKQYLQPSHAFTLWLLAPRRLPTQDRCDYIEVRDVPFMASKRRHRRLCSLTVILCINYGEGSKVCFRCGRRWPQTGGYYEPSSYIIEGPGDW